VTPEAERLARWAAVAAQGVLRSRPDEVEVRKVAGPRGLLAAFNPNLLAEKRPTATWERPPLDQWTVEPFEGSAFHFGKVSEREEIGRVGDARLLVNVSPLGAGHALLIPPGCQPQVLTRAALDAGLAWLHASAADFRVWFNSHSAWSSVNHLHLQGHYVSALGLKQYPVEDARATVVASGAEWAVETLDWPAVVLRVTGAENATKAWQLIGLLLDRDCPHNVILAHAAIFVFPRAPQSVSALPGGEPSFRLSAYELAGLALAETREAFDELDESGFVEMARSVHPADWSVLCGQLLAALTAPR